MSTHDLDWTMGPISQGAQDSDHICSVQDILDLQERLRVRRARIKRLRAIRWWLVVACCSFGAGALSMLPMLWLLP